MRLKKSFLLVMAIVFAVSVAQVSLLPAAAAETDSTEGEGELKANSWRYIDGEPRDSSSEVTPFATSSNAWKKVNGSYVNSAGNVIEGAQKKGIDVSKWNQRIDWEKVKADGIEFAIIRCGYGTDMTSQDDGYWEYNTSECERLGIPYGAYLYSYATDTSKAASEAQHALRLLAGHSPTYPVYLDMEDSSTTSAGKTTLGNIAKTFCDTLSASGYSVGVYANKNWWTNYLTSSVFDDPSWSKWVAQWDAKCTYTGSYDMWQCTEKGSVNGISGNVDLNFWMTTNVPSGGTTVSANLGRTYYFKNSISDGEADSVIVYGKDDDDVLTGDWDGDRIDTLCVRRGASYYFKNSISAGDADVIVPYGKSDDEVYVGDWDGDGTDTLCVRRGNAYYFKNSLSAGDADMVVAYGKSDDEVLVGDWDGDGCDTLCVRRGQGYYFKNSLSTGDADKVVAYGKSTDDVYVGDWDGDAVDTLSVRRGQVYYFKNSLSDGDADAVIAYGKTSDTTLVGDWDGDGCDTLCVRRK